MHSLTRAAIPSEGMQTIIWLGVLRKSSAWMCGCLKIRNESRGRGDRQGRVPTILQR